LADLNSKKFRKQLLKRVLPENPEFLYDFRATFQQGKIEKAFNIYFSDLQLKQTITCENFFNNANKFSA